MMMFAKVSAIVVITLCVLTEQSDAQECFAQSVVDLKLDTSHNLTWSLRPDEPCKVDEYLVFIFHPNQPADYAFTQTQTYVDVSFLEVCEEWIFSVVPISGYTLGAERRIVDKLPLPSYANLTLTDLIVEHNASYPGFTQLHWDLIDKRLGNCSLRYRVTVEKEGYPHIEDYYVNPNSIDLYFLSSCTSYQFGVRAINIADPTIEGPLRSRVIDLPGRAQNPPVVLDVEVGATSANLSFRLESEVRNPCPLRMLYLDGGTFEQNVTLIDEGRRFPVNLTISDLKPNTTYSMRAYVANSVAWSPATGISILTLEQDQDEELSEEIDKSD